MRFWDTSAIVPFLIEEDSSTQVRELVEEDPQIVVWALTPVEAILQWNAAVTDRARRVLRTHRLRAADALQLAAALVMTGDKPGGIGFVCLDSNLRDAARREGFTVRPAESKTP